MDLTPTVSRARAARTLLLLVAGGLGLALAPGLTGTVNAAESSELVDQAGRKLREQDISGAMRLLEQALQANPKDPDAHIMYQDTAREVLGLADIQTTYRRHAQDNPDDALFAYLDARLLQPTPAIAAFKKLALKFKTSAWPQVGLARALEDSGRMNDALEAHDKAIVLGGADVRFRAYQAFALERAKRFSVAADAWKRVIEKVPGDGTARIGLGEALRGAGDFDGAIAVFGEAAKQDPKDPDPVYRIGLAHLDAERYDEAKAALDKALTLDRGMVEALCAASEAILRKTVSKFDEGGVEIDDKALAQAQTYADRAVASNPDSARAHFALGAVLESSGEANADLMDAGLEEYDAALDLLPFPGPDRMRVLSARSYVLLRLARWDEALTAAQKCLDIDPTHVPAYAHGGHALDAMEKHEEAIKKWYEPGLKIAPENPRLLHGIGTSWWNLEKQTKAVKFLKNAVKFEPNNGRYRLSLGEIYYELKKFKESAKELFEATDLRPKDWVTWSAYGRACTAISDWESAVEAYEMVVKIDDEAVDEYLYLAILYADRLKNKKKAKEALEKFLDKDGWDENLESWIDRLLEEEEE